MSSAATQRFEAVHPQIGFRNPLVAAAWAAFPVVGSVLTWFGGNLTHRDAGYWVITVPFDALWTWITVWSYRGMGNPNKNWVELRPEGLHIELFNYRNIDIAWEDIEQIEMRDGGSWLARFPLSRTPKGRHVVLSTRTRRWFPPWTADAAFRGTRFAIEVMDIDRFTSELRERIAAGGVQIDAP